MSISSKPGNGSRASDDDSRTAVKVGESSLPRRDSTIQPVETPSCASATRG